MRTKTLVLWSLRHRFHLPCGLNDRFFYTPNPFILPEDKDHKFL